MCGLACALATLSSCEGVRGDSATGNAALHEITPPVGTGAIAPDQGSGAVGTATPSLTSTDGVPPAAAAAPVLQLRLRSGDRFRRRLQVIDRSTRDFDGVKRQEESERELDFQLQALRWDDQEQLHMQVTFERFRLRMAGPGDAVDFDSARDRDPPPFLQGLAVLVGESFEVILDRRAKLVGVAGVEQLAQAAAAKLPPTELRERLAAALRREFNSAALTALFAPLLPVFPAEPPREGLVWHQHTHPRLHDNVELHQECAWKVRSWSDLEGVFGYTGSAHSDPEKLIDGVWTRGYYDLRGTAEGTVRIDPSSGWLESSDHRLTLQGEFRVGENLVVPEARTRSIRVEQLR